MIYPYFSNSYDLLKALFLQQLTAERHRRTGRAAVFTTLEVVVADEAVKDDITRALAQAQGIAAGVRFVSTRAWLDQLNHGSPDVTGRARALEWAIYALVTDDDFLARPECERLKHYVAKATGSAVWALVTRLAALLSTYAGYRADWLWSWAGVAVPGTDPLRRAREDKVLASHPDYAWQKALWRELCVRTNADGTKLWPTAESFLAIPDKWLARMNEPQRDERDEEDPLFVFLPRELPPLALPQLLAQGRNRAVYLYMQNPSSAFWFDASSTEGFSWFHRNAAVRRALIERVRSFVTPDADPGEAAFLEDNLQDPQEASANRIVPVEALGDVLKLKADAEDAEDVYVRPRDNSFLGQLQTAVLEDDAGQLPSVVPEGDETFLMVRAPNAMREVQTLCDWIGSCIEKSRGTSRPLSADDFLVVTPDIDAMAGVIAAVMNSRSPADRIAYHIAGQSELDVSGTARAMLTAMRFVSGAATAEEFSELIEMPAFAAIRPQLTVNATSIAAWLAAAGYRWGLNETHARSAVAHGLAAPEGDGLFEGTLERAIERLTASDMLGERTIVAGDVLAVRGTELAGREGTSEDADSFEFLLSLAQAFADVGDIPERQTMSAWLESTRRFADTLFAGYAKSPDMGLFMMRAASLATSAQSVLGEQEVSFQTWCSALEKMLKTGKTTVRASGRVTFAGTGAFDGMPFECVAVIGLNDGESFPGSSRREEFDLTAARLSQDEQEINVARRGDRDARESNRGLFLNLMLAARSRFYVSYAIGSGSVPANPSVVLEDLRQAIGEGLEDPGELDAKLTKTVAALPSGAENFDPAMGAIRSRSPQLAQAVNRAIDAGYVADEAAFADAPMAVQKGASLSVDDLTKFLTYPESKSLSILGLVGQDEADADTAPVVRYLEDGNYLFRSRVRRRIVQSLEDGESVDTILQEAACDPTLGEQSVRSLLVDGRVRIIAEVHETLREKLQKMSTLHERRLSGGELVFDELRGEPFDRIAVPAIDCREGADGSLITGIVGISESERVKNFLRFAAVNLLAGQKSERSIDFLCLEALEEKTRRNALWHLKDASGTTPSNDSTPEDAGQTQQSRNTAETLRHVLVSILRLINTHVTKGPILAGTYDEKLSSLLWRGLENFEQAQSRCSDLRGAIESVAMLFDISDEVEKAEREKARDGEATGKKDGRKKSKSDASKRSKELQADSREDFDAVVEVLLRLARTTGERA